MKSQNVGGLQAQEVDNMKTPMKDQTPSLLPHSEYNSTANKKPSAASNDFLRMGGSCNRTPGDLDLLENGRISQSISRLSQTPLQAHRLVSPFINRSNLLLKKLPNFKGQNALSQNAKEESRRLGRKMLKHLTIKSQVENEKCFSTNLQSVLGNILDKRTAYQVSRPGGNLDMRGSKRLRKMSSKEGAPARVKPVSGVLSVSKSNSKREEYDNPYDLSSKKPSKPFRDRSFERGNTLLCQSSGSVSEALSSHFGFHSPRFSDGSFHPHNIRKEVIGYFKTRGYKTVFLHYLVSHLQGIFKRADESRISQQLQEFFGTNLAHFKMLEISPGQCLIKPLLNVAGLC